MRGSKFDLPESCPTPGQVYRYRDAFCICVGAMRRFDGWLAVFEHPSLGRTSLSDEEMKQNTRHPLERV